LKNGDKNTAKKPRGPLKKVLRFFAFSFLAVFSFLVLISILLAFPPVQTFIAKQAAAYFSKELGVTITIDRISISLITRKVNFKELTVLDHHQDTLLTAQELGTKVDVLSISNSRFVLGETKLSNALFRLHKYKGEKGLNLDYILKQFKSDKPKEPSKKPFGFGIRHIELENVAFNYIDETADTLPASFQPGNIRTSIGTGELQDFRIAGDSIIFKVRELRALDRSGSGLAHFETDFVICSTAMMFENTLMETVEGSFVKGDIRFLYSNWRSFGNFIDSVRFDTDIEQSSVRLKDIAFYSDALKGVPVTAKFKGKVTGPVSSFKGRDMELSFGENSGLMMDADLYGLPKVDSLFFDVKVDRLLVTAEDIARLKISEDGLGISLPAEMYRLGKTTYTGRLTGSTWDFVTTGILKSDVGTVYTDLRLATEPGFKHPFYEGTIKTNKFDPGKLIGNTAILGPMSGEVSIKGREFDPKQMQAEIIGTFSSFTLMGYPYANIKLNGAFKKMAFEGNLSIDDENLGLRFDGKTDFAGNTPVFNCYATVENANLQKLGFWKDTLTIHRAVIRLDVATSGIDDIMGIVEADSLSFVVDTNEHFVEHFDVMADSTENERRFQISSSLLAANITGDFKFIPLINNLMYNADSYFPSLHFKYDSVTARASQRLHFDINVKDLKPVFDIFSPGVFVSNNTSLVGRYFSDVRTAELELSSGYIGYKKLRLTDPELSLSTSSGEVEMELTVSRFNVADSLWFDYIKVLSTANNDSVKFGVEWADDVYNISSGNIHFNTWLGNPGQYDLYFHDTKLRLKDRDWTLRDKAFVNYSTRQLLVKDFILTSDFGGSLSVNGVGSDRRDDELKIALDKFPVAYLRTFAEGMPEMGGSLSGTSDITGLFESPIVVANLRIDTLSMYGQRLGDFTFKSGYNNAEEALTLNGELKTESGNSLELKNGKIYPLRKSENMDLDLAFSRFNIKPAEVFIEPVLTNIQGFLSGKLHVGGSFKSPQLSGEAFIDGGHVDVPNIGGSYNLKFKPTKKLRISRSIIDFGEIVLEDDNYKTATLRGSIKHKDFKNMELYAEVVGKEFLFFNATREQSPSFYGTAVATGTAVIKGPFEMLDVLAGVRTEKGTRLFIPMTSGPSQASENSFVIFVDGRDTTKKKDVKIERKNPNGIQLFVDAEINDNAEVQIIFDEFTGDVLRSVGKGNLRIELNRLGDLSMFGDYEVIKGDYLFTLKNLVNKKLKLLQGGTIYWSGNPTKAKIDASASYSLRTSPAPLLPATTSTGGATNTDGVDNNFKARIPVDVIVNLDGDLLEPQITFDIQFPTLDEKTRSQLMQAISTEDEKNKQAFALLVLRQFISSGTGAGDAANVAGGNSLEVLSNQLSNWVSQLSEGIDLGVRYRSKDNTSSGQDEVEVALSTKLFNDRVSIDGNVGVATSKSNTANGNGSILDLTVEVKITDDGKLRIRGFNRSNDANIIRPFPYTQGVGISYQTTFDTWRELFQRKNKAQRDSLRKERLRQQIPPSPDYDAQDQPLEQSAPPDSVLRKSKTDTVRTKPN